MKYKELVIGASIPVKLSGGRTVPSIDFDNASTKPVFASVLNEISNFAPMYANINGGQSQKCVYTEQQYEQTRSDVLDFVKADHKSNDVIFLQNTTEGINKLAYLLSQVHPQAVILTTVMEHHANILPWIGKFTVDFVKVDSFGRLLLDDLEAKLVKYQGRVRLVTVTGASNVTGYINPVHKIAALAHKYNAQICVDGAQLVPHYPVDMKPDDSPEHIDYFVFSAHKMYAPFGIGVLIGPHTLFVNTIPEFVGTNAKTVTCQSVTWKIPPRKEEAGTPGIFGVIALQNALKSLEQLGMENIKIWESKLLKKTVKALRNFPDITMYAEDDSPRIGIIPLNIAGIPHDLLGRIFAQEFGIEVRNGYLSAQPYVEGLLNAWPDSTDSFLNKYRPPQPGMVRISFGLYNTEAEVDIFINVVKAIVDNKKGLVEKYST